MDILKRMLEKNPKKRISVEECLKHEFFGDKFKTPTRPKRETADNFYMSNNDLLENTKNKFSSKMLKFLNNDVKLSAQNISLNMLPSIFRNKSSSGKVRTRG